VGRQAELAYPFLRARAASPPWRRRVTWPWPARRRNIPAADRSHLL